MTKNTASGQGNSVVEYSTNNCEVKGSNPAAGCGRERKKKLFEFSFPPF